MSHRGVEVILGRLATDAAMRRRFRENPGLCLSEIAEQGIELSAVERAALERLDAVAIQGFAEALDPRLQKALLDSSNGSGTTDADAPAGTRTGGRE